MQEHSGKEIEANLSIDGKRNFGDRCLAHLREDHELKDNLRVWSFVKALSSDQQQQVIRCEKKSRLIRFLQRPGRLAS